MSIAETRAAVRHEYGEVGPHNIADVLAGTAAIWTKWADALDRSHKASRSRQVRGFAEHITAIAAEYAAWIDRRAAALAETEARSCELCGHRARISDGVITHSTECPAFEHRIEYRCTQCPTTFNALSGAAVHSAATGHVVLPADNFCDCAEPNPEPHGDRRQCLDCGGEIADGDE